MLVHMLKSKIHCARVTEANLHYVGSITVDPLLLEACGMLPGEQVSVVNVSNGERLETYTIAGERGLGQICLNGAAARKCAVGDIVIIMAYALMTPEEAQHFTPTVIFPDATTNSLPPAP